MHLDADQPRAVGEPMNLASVLCSSILCSSQRDRPKRRHEAQSPLLLAKAAF
jgi:hypothetical protein